MESSEYRSSTVAEGQDRHRQQAPRKDRGDFFDFEGRSARGIFGAIFCVSLGPLLLPPLLSLHVPTGVTGAACAIVVGYIVWRDARRAGMRAWAWALLAALAFPPLVGVAIYAWRRSRHHRANSEEGVLQSDALLTVRKQLDSTRRLTWALACIVAALVALLAWQNLLVPAPAGTQVRTYGNLAPPNTQSNQSLAPMRFSPQQDAPSYSPQFPTAEPPRYSTSQPVPTMQPYPTAEPPRYPTSQPVPTMQPYPTAEPPRYPTSQPVPTMQPYPAGGSSQFPPPYGARDSSTQQQQRRFP